MINLEYDIKVIFNDGLSELHSQSATNRFDALRTFLNSSKGAINENIKSISIE